MPRSLTTHIDSPKAVGQRLREARERAGLSQRQLAFPGCTAAYISRLEAGARVPSLQMVNQLAARLDVSGQWLATGVDAAVVTPDDLIDAEVALRLGETAEAEALYRAHLEEGDPARATALAGIGQIAYREDRLDEAIVHLEDALRARNRRALADVAAVDTLGRCYAQTGSLDAAIALFGSAVEEARAADARIEELRFSVLLANANIDAANFGAAQAVLARVIQIAEEIGDPVASARLYWSQSRLHSMRHEPELAGRYARRALEILERTEHDAYIGMAYHLLAHAELQSGNAEEALGLLARGRDLFGRELGARDDARFSTEEARALLVAGRPREAARAAARALELLDVLGAGDRGIAYVALADVFRSAGDPQRARMLLGQALDILIEFGANKALEAARPLADLLEEDGDTAGALAVMKRAAAASAGATARS
ncbi:MAG TPA: helix-turn-helix domain-containing protein [Gaiellaceae bacterium]|nr:helix-turn-helix domain-containing protein [Gaiellaceae bacterium]